MSRLHNLLRKKNKPNKCGFCHTVIVKDDTHSGVFYKVPGEDDESGIIHQECWEKYHEKCSMKCLHCQGPVAHLPGRFNGKFYPSTDPPGKVHSECWEAFTSSSSKPSKETCSQCGEALAVVEGKFSGTFFKLQGGLKVHAECRSAYHLEHTERCLQCNEPVAPEKGKFSGDFFELEGKGRVHSECNDMYEEATADECLACKKAVRRTEEFSGDFMMFDGGNVHKECASEYQEMVADKCVHCNKGVRHGGGFSGSFYAVDQKPADTKGQEVAKVHLECFEAYQEKLAGSGGGEISAPVPGTFDATGSAAGGKSAPCSTDEAETTSETKTDAAVDGTAEDAARETLAA